MRIAFARALDVRQVAEGSSELAFLVGAMWTPVQAIHFCILAGETLGEGIVFMILEISTGKKYADKKSQNNNVKHDLVLLTAVAFVGLLSFSFFFGHDSF